VHLRYRDHYLADGGKARIILGVLVTAADVMENMPFLDMVWRACFRWQLRPRSATGDTTYGTVEIIRALEDAGIRAYVPLTIGTSARPCLAARPSATMPKLTTTPARMARSYTGLDTTM
jgi:hypothetical protein